MTFNKVMKRIALISIALFVAGSIMAAVTYALGASTSYTINEQGQVVPSTDGFQWSFGLNTGNHDLMVPALPASSAPSTQTPPTLPTPPAPPNGN
ncbi:MAG: hypothetical protein LBS58_01475 [Coriobacteriales bacterium]|jgi:type 1 fimbria pilin|nr:hypothetical protein [Coriobacteriales bacterium]